MLEPLEPRLRRERVRESDLYQPVRDWLVAQGYEVHVEVFDADIVATKDGRLIAVELKPCLTDGLTLQLHHRAGWADEVWAAVSSEPRITSILRDAGYGLLQVVNGRVRKRFKARPQPWGWHSRHAYRLKKLANREPAHDHELAGLPCCPQLREQRRLRSKEAEV